MLPAAGRYLGKRSHWWARRSVSVEAELSLHTWANALLKFVCLPFLQLLKQVHVGVFG